MAKLHLHSISPETGRHAVERCEATKPRTRADLRWRVEGQSTGIGWVNWKTGETKSLAPVPQWGRFAASADGQWVAYTTTLDQPGQQTGNDGISADVWRVPISGGEPEKLFRFPSRVHDLCWADVGEPLRDSSSARTDVEAGKIRSGNDDLSRQKVSLGEADLRGGLYVVSELGGGQAHYDIWHVPLHEPLQRMRKLTFGQGDEDRPSVSHDGRWLVFR